MVYWKTYLFSKCSCQVGRTLFIIGTQNLDSGLSEFDATTQESERLKFSLQKLWCRYRPADPPDWIPLKLDSSYVFKLFNLKQIENLKQIWSWLFTVNNVKTDVLSFASRKLQCIVWENVLNKTKGMLYFLVSNYTAGCLQLYSFQLLKWLPQKKQYSWCNCFFVSRLLSALPWLTQRLELLIYFHVSGSNIFFLSSKWFKV